MSFQLNGGCTVKFQPWSKLSFFYSVVIFLTMIGFREATVFTSVEGPELVCILGCFLCGFRF